MPIWRHRAYAGLRSTTGAFLPASLQHASAGIALLDGEPWRILPAQAADSFALGNAYTCSIESQGFPRPKCTRISVMSEIHQKHVAERVGQRSG